MTLRGPDNLESLTPPDKLGELLTEHLTTVLEPQRGKALTAFRAKVGGGSSPILPIRAASAPNRWSDGLVSRKALWIWAGAPSLLAACVAVVVTLAVVHPGQTAHHPDSLASTTNPDAGGAIVVDSPQVNQTVVTRNEAGDVVVNNNVPMRLVRQQEIRQTQWIDPRDHATYTVTQPVEKAGYIQVHPD